MGDQSIDSPNDSVPLPDYLQEPGASLSLLTQMLGATDSLVLLLEGDSRQVAAASASVFRLVGSDVLGKSFQELHETQGRPVETDALAFSCQLRALAGPVPVTYQVRPVHVGDRQLLLLIGRDIKELVAWRRQLESSGPMQSICNLAGGIAHELNNLFGGIISYSDFALNYDRSPEAIRKGLAFSLDSLEKAARITDALRRFAQVSFGRFRPIDMQELIEIVLAMLEQEIHAKQANVVRQLDNVPKVRGEHDQIKQVVHQLVLNALQAISDGGAITVELHYQFPFVYFSVADDGHGIPEESLQKIFQPFFTTRGVFGGGDTEGTGLGLAVAQGIVQTHGGRISVSSEVGKGSTFTVTLPTNVPGLDAEAGESDRPKVLIADDDEGMLFILSQALELNGYKAVACGSGMEALARASREKPDAAVLDIRSPQLDGISLLKSFHQIYPNIPVIMLSSADDEAVRAQALDAGAKDYIVKSSDPNRVIEAIKRLVSPGETHADDSADEGDSPDD